MHVLVLAKTPVAGRVKTRLCPPCTPAEAAEVAAAALADTLDAVVACGASRRILALDGAPGPWIPAGFEIVAQRGDGLAERLGAAWSDAGGPGLQIGMDTPQVSANLLDRSLGALDLAMTGRDGAVTGEDRVVAGGKASGRPGDVAVLGPALDGGWWAVGLSRADPAVFSGVPMSSADTGRAQRERLLGLGWAVRDLPELRDIDSMADLRAVAGLIPHSRTAAAAARIGDQPVAGG